MTATGGWCGRRAVRGWQGSERRRLIATGALVVMTVVGAVAITPATASPELQYSYVANRSTWVFGMHLAEALAETATGDDWSVTGFNFRPVGSESVITVDDAAALPGVTVPVLVVKVRADGERDFTALCAPDSQPVTVAIQQPTDRVAVLVYNHVESPWSGCRAGLAGTTGTITVQP